MDNETRKLYKEIGETNLKQNKKDRIEAYLLNNWIAIAALVISLIALLKQ